MTEKTLKKPSSAAVWILRFALLAACIAILWVGFFYWIERSARSAIYEQDSPESAVASLERWSPIMFYPKEWRWLTAEGYRKMGDRARVTRISDELKANGMSTIRAGGPLLLMDSSSGVPAHLKENLAPLLVAYGKHAPDVLASMVQGFIVQGEATVASQTIRLWEELYDDDYLLEYWKGVLATTKYDLDSSVINFQKSIALKSDFARAHEELGEVYLERSEFEQAKNEFEWLVNHTKPTPKTYSGYARSLLNLGLIDEAADQLAKLEDVSKLPSPELALVCETNLEAKRFEVAREQAILLTKRWPAAMPYLQLLAKCDRGLKNEEASKQGFDEASVSERKRPEVDQLLDRLKLDPNNQPLRRDMGEMMMFYLDPAGGAGYIQAASRANPIDVKAHSLLITYFEREGNEEQAEIHRRALRQIQQMVTQPGERL